jgi:hypothetical protein
VIKMANPAIPKPIKVTVTGGAKGQPLSVRNRTTGEVQVVQLGEDGKAIVSLQNFPSGFTSGDVIDFAVCGEKMGQASLTTSGDAGQSVTVTTASIASGLARGI